MLAYLVALQVAAAAPAAESPATITVTGNRVADYAAALDACVAAHCSPRRDIVASIRYAEALFRVGDYHGAREMLARATRRNARVGEQEPLALSQLYLAQANVAVHFGEQNDVKSATVASARVADTYLPAGDPDRLGADLRLADWRLSSQSLERTKRNRAIADADYTRIAGEARASGHQDIAADADLHHAWALHARHDDDAALALLGAISAVTDPAVAPYRLAARITTARIAYARGDRKAINVVVASLHSNFGSDAPILIYSPPFPRPTDPAYRSTSLGPVDDNITRPVDLNGLQWADIGFAIRSDGSVDTPEVVRGSRRVDWAGPLIAMIADRRYSPTAGNEAAPGHYRVERYTLTADFGTPIGSLIRRRVGAPRYQQLDLTDDAPRKIG